MKRSNKGRNGKIVAGLLSLTVLCTSLLGSCGLFEEESSEKSLYINEVMSSNQSALADEDGEYSDWIELYNNTDTEIDLAGYYLSDSAYDSTKWQFPDVSIGAHSYLVVFASGKDKVESNGITCHTNFKLSANGENVVLSTESVASVDAFTLPALGENQSYGRVESGENAGKYGVMLAPTPGSTNSDILPEGSSDGDTSGTVNLTGTGEILITEYMSKNDYICYDADGDYSDWVELYNTTDSDISLNGYYLTTKTDNLQDWAFPDVSIPAKGYLLIWLSGKDKVTENGEIHADFKLGSSDPVLILSAGTVIDSATVYSLPGNVSYGRDATDNSKWVYYAKPTPGKANTSTPYDSLGNATALSAKGVWVSEVSAVSLPYNDKSDTDWIELYNGTGEAVNLSGYGLSDNLEEKYAYTFGDVTIKAGEYLLVYAVGTKDNSGSTKGIRANISFKANGETVYLTAPDGITIDAYETGRMRENYSSGRLGTLDDVRYFFETPTPGKANSGKTYTTYTAVPEISQEGGYVTSGTTVTVSAPEGVSIYYTLDGSEPTTSAQLYTGGISLVSNTVLKVIAVEQGKMASNVVTNTYIVGKTHTIPVVCLSADPDDLFGYNNGILANGPGYAEPFPYQYANFWKDWEREATFEYYDATGTKQLCFQAGVKVFGQYSQAYAQKSLSIHMRNDYGTDSITYPFFDDNAVTTLSNMVLRAGGQDQNYARIRDAFCAQVMKGQTTLALMDWQPVVLYLNGEYYGFYEIREKINESYLESHYGIDPDNVDIIKGNKNVLSGSFDNYSELLNYVKTHDLSKSEYYNVVANWVDIDNFIDYLITEIYFCNGDTGNKKFYRENTEGAKWQWVMFDFDMTLRSDSINGVTNSIKAMFNTSGHGSGNAFSTVLQCALIKNDTFKNKFLERYAYHLNNTFQPERMNAILDSMVAEIDGEMDMHCKRWERPSTYEEWTAQVSGLKNIINKRRAQAIKELKAYFNLSDAKMAELFPNG